MNHEWLTRFVPKSAWPVIKEHLLLHDKHIETLKQLEVLKSLLLEECCRRQSLEEELRMLKQRINKRDM